MTLVTLYTKPGCHLCDEALTALRRVQEDVPFELSERDITADDRLHRAYFERIPVVAVEGEELFDYFVDEALLIERLRTAGQHQGERPPAAAQRRGERPGEAS